jgi:hypothetical protein
MWIWLAYYAKLTGGWTEAISRTVTIGRTFMAVTVKMPGAAA